MHTPERSFTTELIKENEVYVQFLLLDDDSYHSLSKTNSSTLKQLKNNKDINQEAAPLSLSLSERHNLVDIFFYSSCALVVQNVTSFLCFSD